MYAIKNGFPFGDLPQEGLVKPINEPQRGVSCEAHTAVAKARFGEAGLIQKVTCAEEGGGILRYLFFRERVEIFLGSVVVV